MKTRSKFLGVMKNTLIGSAVAIYTVLTAGTVNAQQKGYVCGDFHQHSTYTDGSYSIQYMMDKNVEFGLDWWANSEHGGGFSRDGAVSGIDKGVTVYYDEYIPYPIIGDPGPPSYGGHDPMWRWQSLRDYCFPEILIARTTYPEKVIIQGYEWNVPGHEHGSVGVITGQFTDSPNVNALAEFEYKFDGYDGDVSGGAAQGWTKSTLSGHEKTLEGITWLQANHQFTSWVIPAHPERKGRYTISDFRDMNNAGPDVCFGFESMPGHQKSSNRGGYRTSADGGGTYGGCGVFAAQIGGLWDALLSEGRHFWLFASSDFHNEGADFYPGEYQKTYTYVTDMDDPQEIVNGLRSGNSWVVEGDLITMLDFQVKGMNNATMGGSVTYNKKIDLEIIIRDPQTYNHNGDNPVLDHVDIIMGKITGEVLPGDDNYNNPSAPETKVIARFDNVGGITSPDGITSIKWHRIGNDRIKIDYTLRDVSDACYFRLRGTNQGLGVENETDENGNPLLDFLMGSNTAEKTFKDLWFYSNPVFVYPKDNNKSASIDVDGGESIETGILDNIILYPNPVNNEIRIGNISIDETINVEIFDVTGKLILSKQMVGNGSIDISSVPKGVYIATFSNGSELATKKILKK
jgi:hypothetical protein